VEINYQCMFDGERGTITRIGKYLAFRPDGDEEEFTVHPKQCRRLKKKAPRRRVVINIDLSGRIRGAQFLTDSGYGGGPVLGAFFSDNDNVEFVEVRRPAGSSAQKGKGKSQ
jgi:hypothetical protein